MIYDKLFGKVSVLSLLLPMISLITLHEVLMSDFIFVTGSDSRVFQNFSLSLRIAFCSFYLPFHFL